MTDNRFLCFYLWIDGKGREKWNWELGIGYWVLRYLGIWVLRYLGIRYWVLGIEVFGYLGIEVFGN
jgi:hypothetical protein